ncbi:MAG: hypothetical protein K6E54_08495 [Bacteroidaceae bacterium]|nr:hypothetical protein [Bacteroidaceae bacterium]
MRKYIFKIIKKEQLENELDNLAEVTINGVIHYLEDKEAWLTSQSDIFHQLIFSEPANESGSILLVLEETTSNVYKGASDYSLHKIINLNEQKTIFDLYLIAPLEDQALIKCDCYQRAVDYFEKIGADEIVSALKIIKGSVFLEKRKKELI